MRQGREHIVERNFISQQGFELPPMDARPALMSALLFQPAVVGLWLLAGCALGSGYVILALAAALWWSALVPSQNPFDFVRNRLPAGRSQRARLGPAPAPRRFAQGMVGTLAAAVGASLLAGATYVAVAISVVFFLAVGLLVLERFCFGSFVYHLLRGRVAFAVRTLPWSRESSSA